MHRLTTFALVLAVVALAAVAAGCGGDEDDTAAPPAATGGETTPEPSEPCAATIGLNAPITGPAASIGEEILNWSSLSIERFNEEHGTEFELEEGDNQLDPAQASTVAQRFVSNDDIVVVLGPAGSQNVEAVGPIFGPADMAMISMSATRDSLTEGDFPTFFRVVPKDSAQGPTDAQFMLDELEADTVVVIDDQTSYSTGLADSATATLEEGGATVIRESVNQDATDFSAIAASIPDEADVVFTPWQLPAQGQVFYDQLREQGKEIQLFGADGFFQPTEFQGEGTYVSTFAPDIRAEPEHAELVEQYTSEHGDFGTFGPPSYAAAQMAMTAIKSLCDAGEEVTRAAVVEQLRETRLEDSVLGGALAFDENGDIEGGRFYIYRYTDGAFEFVQ